MDYAVMMCTQKVYEMFQFSDFSKPKVSKNGQYYVLTWDDTVWARGTEPYEEVTLVMAMVYDNHSNDNNYGYKLIVVNNDKEERERIYMNDVGEDLFWEFGTELKIVLPTNTERKGA